MAHREIRSTPIHRDLRGLLRHGEGATAVEMAIVFPLLLSFVFGIIEAGHVMWTLNALNMAVEDAARCVSVSNVGTNAGKNPPCLDQVGMQNYAASRTWGLTIPKTEFQLTTPACGYQVSITHHFVPFVNWFPLNFNMQAQACFPQWQ